MAVATILAIAVHQPVDLALGEITSFNCQVYDGWTAFSGPRFHRNKAPLIEAYWLSYTPGGTFGFSKSVLDFSTLTRSRRLTRACRRDRADSATERKVRQQLAKGVGILRVAKSLGIGTGTVQRISKGRAMSLRGAEQ